jgi:hypothetical protein
MPDERASPDESNEPTGHRRLAPRPEGASVVRGDPVEEASWESFPASDPPAWAPLRFGPPADLARSDGDDEPDR